MNAEHDKQDELQKMLALKRHEAPPPRFFKGFSHQVIDRLHSPEPAVPQSLWQRLRADLESRPVLVCGSGIIVCGLLVVGLIASLRVQPPKPAPRQAGDEALWTVSPSAAAMATPAMTPTIPVEQLRIGDPVLISEPSPFLQGKLGNPVPSSQLPLK